MYSEADKTYNAIPSWVESAIRAGYQWDKERNPWKRRIGLVSMPCKSTAGPLIALGALRKDLELENANDIDGHFEALCRTRDAYLKNPESIDGVLIKDHDKKIKKWTISGGIHDQINVVDSRYRTKVKRKGRWVSNPNGPVEMSINKETARQWRSAGEPIIQVESPNEMLCQKDYESVQGCTGRILTENLQRSFSGLLLVGDAEGGGSSYMNRIAGVKMKVSEQQTSLDKLLTLNQSPDRVTRLSLVNKSHIANRSLDHHLVIADGILASIKAIEYFRNSDIIVVYSRDEPIDNLDLLASKYIELQKYYQIIDTDFGADYQGSSIEFCLLEQR